MTKSEIEIMLKSDNLDLKAIAWDTAEELASLLTNGTDTQLDRDEAFVKISHAMKAAYEIAVESTKAMLADEDDGEVIDVEFEVVDIIVDN